MLGKGVKRVLAVMGALVVAAGIAVVSMRYAPRRTPEGQPPLASLREGDLRSFEDAFNAGAGSTRVLAMLSPT